ncbi:MAG TPA: hypothetical protein VJB65_00815 [Patescibacteria group bacterium]|nr:hypothetical protein [Patescibacteria group bacterium]
MKGNAVENRRVRSTQKRGRSRTEQREATTVPSPRELPTHEIGTEVQQAANIFLQERVPTYAEAKALVTNEDTLRETVAWFREPVVARRLLLRAVAAAEKMAAEDPKKTYAGKIDVDTAYTDYLSQLPGVVEMADEMPVGNADEQKVGKTAMGPIRLPEGAPVIPNIDMGIDGAVDIKQYEYDQDAEEADEEVDTNAELGLTWREDLKETFENAENDLDLTPELDEAEIQNFKQYAEAYTKWNTARKAVIEAKQQAVKERFDALLLSGFDDSAEVKRAYAYLHANPVPQKVNGVLDQTYTQARWVVENQIKKIRSELKKDSNFTAQQRQRFQQSETLRAEMGALKNANVLQFIVEAETEYRLSPAQIAAAVLESNPNNADTLSEALISQKKQVLAAQREKRRQKKAQQTSQ